MYNVKDQRYWTLKRGFFVPYRTKKKRITSIIIKFDVVHDRNTNGTIHAKLFFYPLQYIIPESIELAMKVEYHWYIRCLMWEMFDIRWMLSIYTHHYFGRVWNKRFNRFSIFYPFNKIVFTFFYSKYYYWCCCQIRNFLIRWHCMQPK